MNVQSINRFLEKTQAEFLKKDLDSALLSAQQALELKEPHNALNEVIQAKILIGKILCTKGHFIGDPDCFSKAFEELQSIDVQSVSNPEKINLALVLSEVNRLVEDWDKARVFAKKALEESQKEGNEVLIVRSLIAESEVFILKNQFTEALGLANQALGNVNQIDDQVLRAEVYNLMCKIHIKRQEYDQILDFAEEVLRISRTYGDVEKEIVASSNLAVYYGSQLDYKRAIQYLYDSLEKSEAINFDRQTAQNLINIGTIYARLFNSKEALNKYESVVEK